jgi:Uncharacterised nucleotidyltransferase
MDEQPGLVPVPQTLMIGLLAAALRERPAPMPPRDTWGQVLECARAHGVLPLLAAAGAAGGWDRELIGAMRPAVAAEAALTIVRERELVRVLDALERYRVAPLLIKGAHLAYTVYPSPDRRPRLDTDLLVRDEDREPLRQCLIEAGYRPVPHVTGEIAFRQCQYERIDAAGASHTIDVHWRLANPRAFADRVAYADLIDGAVSIPRLGPHARGPRPAVALLVACIHRTAHHGASDRLLWLYDIHLLASALGDRGWGEVTTMAVRCGLAPVLSSGLTDTRDVLATAVPAAVIHTLAERASQTDPDVLTFLDGASRLQVMASDWHRLSGWRDRTGFLREHLFPSPVYMSHKYGSAWNVMLPFLYARRIIAGAWREAVKPF